MINRKQRKLLYRFLLSNPKITDDQFHQWTESSGIDKDQAEEACYTLAHKMVQMMVSGLSNDKKFRVRDADINELSAGINVELEHTPCKVVATKIALDHLAEIPDYYTRLKRMEKEAGVED